MHCACCQIQMERVVVPQSLCDQQSQLFVFVSSFSPDWHNSPSKLTLTLSIYSRLIIKVLTLFVLCECFLWLGLLSLREAITRAEPDPWLDRDRDTQPRHEE